MTHKYIMSLFSLIQFLKLQVLSKVLSYIRNTITVIQKNWSITTASLLCTQFV